MEYYEEIIKSGSLEKRYSTNIRNSDVVPLAG